MFCEAIPGCVLQMYVVLKALKGVTSHSTSSIVSLCISALSTGYSSATIRYVRAKRVRERREISAKS